MNQLALGMLVAVVLACAAPRASAAPIPKDAGKNDPTPDLKAVFDVVSKAVKDEKWPAEVGREDDEKKLKDTARVVFERMLKAADQKERKLPVDFEKLEKLDVREERNDVNLESAFVIAGVVRGGSPKDSVIFATGDIEIGRPTNCVIVARNVSCVALDNCVVVADECIYVQSVKPRQQGESGSVLVAGQWIRSRHLDDAICHVLRPGNLPTPDEAMFKPNRPFPAIGHNVATNVVFLNAKEDTGLVFGLGVPEKNCTYASPKFPIAK